jgi:hypothetical protein
MPDRTSGSGFGAPSQMSIRLPSRYEDLDVAFRGHLRPNGALINQVQNAFRSMQVSGGIRLLPVYGKSGSGKSSAALELSTHLPETRVFNLSRDAIESRQHLVNEVRDTAIQHSSAPAIAVIDQFEEVAAQQSRIPKEFVESLALLDRGDLRNNPTLFIWLTTDRGFQADLVNATTRNSRILVSPSFEIIGPAVADWPKIIEETFSFHNDGTVLADYMLLEPELQEISKKAASIGQAIEEVGRRLTAGSPVLQDISRYQVFMLWPVTDSTRIARIQQFTDARQGYKLNWSAFFQSLAIEDQRSHELRELNRARLYFDLRLVPIAAADLQGICRRDDGDEIPKAALGRFSKTHFYSLIKRKWDPDSYAPLRERESQRADDARAWYGRATGDPTRIGKSIAKALTELGVRAFHERKVKTPHGSVRADVLAERDGGPRSEVIIELKAFAPENTRPSSISDAVKSTLRKHAILLGFLKR